MERTPSREAADRSQCPLTSWLATVLIGTQVLLRPAAGDQPSREIPLDAETLILADELRQDDAPKDLADRQLIAGAMSRRGRLATADREILDWEGPLERIDVRC